MSLVAHHDANTAPTPPPPPRPRVRRQARADAPRRRRRPSHHPSLDRLVPRRPPFAHHSHQREHRSHRARALRRLARVPRLERRRRRARARRAQRVHRSHPSLARARARARRHLDARDAVHVDDARARAVVAVDDGVDDVATPKRATPVARVVAARARHAPRAAPRRRRGSRGAESRAR